MVNYKIQGNKLILRTKKRGSLSLTNPRQRVANYQREASIGGELREPPLKVIIMERKRKCNVESLEREQLLHSR